MTTVSKFFAEHIQWRTCQEILHSDTCRKHLTKDFILYSLSNLKYFAPVCLLPLLIKIRNINKKEFGKTLKYYLYCAATGTSVGYTINLLMCLLRNLNGGFAYYTFTFIPSYLGGNLIYLAPARVVNLFETSIFQCTIETFFLMRKNILSRTIANSKMIQTLLFMICSALILHCKQMYNTEGFWLLKPNPKINLTVNREKCPECGLHPQKTCQQYLIDGLRKYLVLGLSLDLIKMLMSCLNRTQNRSKLLDILKKFRVHSTALLTAYIGIYRFAHCRLNRKFEHSYDGNHILSAFLAGLSYYFYPQSTLFSLALVQAIQSVWKMLEMKNVNSKKKHINLLLAIPYARILCPLSLGNLVHLALLQPKYVSLLATTITDGVTDKYCSKVQKEVNLLKAKYKFEANR